MIIQFLLCETRIVMYSELEHQATSPDLAKTSADGGHTEAEEAS